MAKPITNRDGTIDSLEVEQLLVDAAAVIEDLTDDLDEDLYDARGIAGRLRDLAAVLRVTSK